MRLETTPEVRLRMSRQKTRDTVMELAVRKALFAGGLRYRVNYPVPGLARRTIDIAFPKRRVAVFIDGCFWHGCAEHSVESKTNTAWWSAKVAANMARDRDTDQRLTSEGWQVVRVWEHEHAGKAAERIRTALEIPGLDIQD